MPAWRERVLGLPIDAVDLPRAMDRVRQSVDTGAPLHAVTLNAEMAIAALDDPELGHIIQSSELVVPDGSGIVWALTRQGVRVRKVAGTALAEAIVAEAASAGWKVYFLGARPGVAAEAARALCDRHPSLDVVGYRDGYFSALDESAVLEGIRAAGPVVLLVALGVPRQEKWIASHQRALGVPIAMGVGGALDVFAGHVKRAPAGFQRLHVEWLYRLYQEPWRFRRMVSALPRFVIEVLRHGHPPRGSEVPS